MFKIELRKNSKTYAVYNDRYVFKEDWLIQAARLGKKTALDFIAFFDEHFEEKVRITREYYTCDVEKVFLGPAGFKIEFIDKKSAQEYCNILNGES